ncbi:antibiotic ABC transporter ATP-binding protein [Taibaiella sp. KBW10]|uniref:ABC transporter ATP-binding protein n=1 Tax=Taibaiella sp. KBW10 TaxID=2153357 RepID=UPI000F5A2F6E|nr:ABC transporter ATP-binding protein [Taibaiella sp. KBW10]RQO32011.1 antibiotic ABC transporter ATP-binding protein [Taibaiella sp. KBW10]
MKNIPKLWRYIRNDKGKLLVYFICSLLSTVFALFSFTMIAPVLQTIFTGKQTLPDTKGNIITTITSFFNDVITTDGKMTALTYSVVLVVLATVLKNAFLYLSLRILNPVKNNVLRRLREDMFNKSLSLPIGYFTEEKKGDLISKMTNDIGEVETSIIGVIETILREPITIIAVLVYMFTMSVPLTLFMFLFLPVAGLIIGRVGKSLKKPSNQAQEQLGDMLGTIDETLVGMRVVKAFNAETHQRSKFVRLNNDLFRIKNKIALRRDAGSPMSETLGIIVVCIILWFGGRLIFSGEGSLTGPFFIVYIGLFYQIINPLKNLSSVFYNMQKGAAALDRVESFLSTENNILERKNPVPVNGFEEAIVFENVSFSYGNKEILKNINLTIQKGKTVALVGSSGAGKSTLVDLIPRFHDVQSGKITIDGVDVRDCKIFDLRKQIGVVSQEPILFNDTIYNNITLGTGGAQQADVTAAARIANAQKFIEQKTNTYQSNVGERGSKLSGGERQRVTIARAILKNPPILILDEATSALDTESEKVVQDAINELMKNRTSIVIAHRLSTIYNADEIIVMEKGEIVERGTHQELIARSGTYHKLVSMQQFK